MPVASLFLSRTWEKVAFPLNAPGSILMATGCVLSLYPSRAILALWPHGTALVDSCPWTTRKDGLPRFALSLTGKGDSPAVVGCPPRPYCLADLGACCEPWSKIQPQKVLLSCRSRC